VHVDAWARHLTEALALAPAAIARRLAAVSAFYRWCVLEQHLSTNPAVHARRPEVDPNASTTLGLTPEHARTLLAGAAEHSPRMLALVTLLLIDGLRISEALSLDVDDVQHVDRGHRIVDLRRKGGHAARAALPPLVSDAIDTYLAHRADQGADRDQGADAPAARRGPTGPLFVTRTGARWRPGNAARALTALATHVEIPGATRVTPHALRHAAITLALDAGVPLHEVQDFAGHRDPRSTRRYDRARGRLDRHASMPSSPPHLSRSGCSIGCCPRSGTPAPTALPPGLDRCPVCTSWPSGPAVGYVIVRCRARIVVGTVMER
jgi:integrase/recombinase XerD